MDTTTDDPPLAEALPVFDADLEQSSVSGLSSGAFMTVQLHLAYSSLFAGAGVIAGGPYRCAESFRSPSQIAEDAYVQNALFICMNPLIPEAGPNPEQLVGMARQTAAERMIDALAGLARARLYIFTGTQDRVVGSSVVKSTKRFYELLGVDPGQIQFVGDVPAGHAILTTNLEDNPTGANRPPYINRWQGVRLGETAPSMQSWHLLKWIYPELKAPVARATGQLLRFDQREFLGGSTRSSMSAYGYVYVPQAVADGAPCRIHVALHGCKQGYNYVDLSNGRPDRANDPPYGSRYFTTTGYNEVADANNLVVLYPQAEGIDNGYTQNPDGCWDWWGYSDESADHPDYYSRSAVQIKAIHDMLTRLGGG